MCWNENFVEFQYVHLHCNKTEIEAKFEEKKIIGDENKNLRAEKIVG